MIAQERQQEIIKILRESKVIRITDIVNRFDVSHETARRDLEYLKEQNLVKRVHGGAVFINHPKEDLFSHLSNKEIGYAERVAIGKLTADLVCEGDTILLGVGTTMVEVAKNIKHKRNLTVITYSIPAMIELINSDVDVYLLGGKLNKDELVMTGSLVRDTLCKFYVDKAIVGASGITFDEGISDYSSEDTSLTKLITGRTDKVILAAHSAKFGVNAFAMECTLRDIHVVVSDTNLSEEYRHGICEMGIELFLADPVYE
ncbi:DeoR/GlpR family DNA-binding transcription regulator [Treponema sp. OttesenSCG-928-L16]|nr:DeoR/GlpR family DNA-binding transcription regulator [Treponema sp. OttesenSCG-928-L16]